MDSINSPANMPVGHAGQAGKPPARQEVSSLAPPPPDAQEGSPWDTPPQPLKQSALPPNSVKFEPTQGNLAQLISQGLAALHRAGTPHDLDATRQALQHALAADSAFSESDLLTEKQRFADQLARLHDAEARVYPSRDTTDAWEGIMKAIDGALAERKAGSLP